VGAKYGVTCGLVGWEDLLGLGRLGRSQGDQVHVDWWAVVAWDEDSERVRKFETGDAGAWS